MPDSQLDDSPELVSRASFIEKFLPKYGENKASFYNDTLQSAINKVRNIKLTTNERILILLYLHNGFDHFSNEFCNLLVSKEWRDMKVNKFYLVAWDITEDKISKSLKPIAKRTFGYNVIYEKLIKQQSSLFVISPSITVVEHIDNTTSLKHFPFNFKYRLNILRNIHPESQSEDVDGGDEICAERFQQLMYEYLGDRDFDSFEYDEHEYLKKKIFFAIYGLPDPLEDNEQKEQVVNETYNQIRSTNNRYCKWDDKIVLSFIYNCTETSRKTTNTMHPLPIFIVRKCKSDTNPCRLFIDLDLRVYTSWANYLQKNKLPKCKMIVPKCGRYKADPSGNVLLETYKSPRCSKSAQILKYFDIIVTILALISAFAMVGSLMFPFLALPAGIVGLICAIYSITRTSMQIHDRRIHKQDMNIRNADARGAYLNILGNSVGIIAGALTRTVAIIATKGIKIGKAVVTTVNAFNYAGISTDFAGLLNAIHAIQGTEKPDALQVLQFAFSILFFNNSVVNLVKTKGQLIQSEISQSMKTNLMNRPIHKTTGQTVTHLRSIHSNDVIKTLNNITNNASRSKPINFSNDNGRIVLNNIPVTIMRQTVVKFQGMFLPPTSHITKIIQVKFLTDEENVELYIDILHSFPDRIKNLIVELAKKLLQLLKEERLNFSETVKKIFPHSTYVAKILEIIILFFEDKFDMECQATESEEDKKESFFRMIENCYALNPSLLMDLTQFYLDWITTAIYEFERARTSREKRRQAQKNLKIKIYCKKCGGHYYKYAKKHNYGILFI